MTLDFSVLGAFIGVCLVVVLAPGSSTVLMIRSSLGGGPKSGYAAWLGNNIGNMVYAGLVVSGLGVLLAEHRSLMVAIQVLGGLYLLWLAIAGARSALHAFRLRGAVPEGVEVFSAITSPPGASFRRGFLTNMTNAKILIFFLSLLPQFVGSAESPVAQMAMLGAVFVGMAMAWEAVVVLLAVQVRRVMGHPMFPVVFESLCAVVFFGLAAFVFREMLRTLGL